MSNPPDRFDREFRRRASGLRRAPAAREWNRIEARLERRDRRRGLASPRVRPWLIAALLLLVAGVAILTDLGHSATDADALARRAESVEELDLPGPAPAAPPPAAPRLRADYTPIAEGQPGRRSLTSPRLRARPGRLTVAPKYRGVVN